MTVAQVMEQVMHRYPHAYDVAYQLPHIQRLENMARRDFFQKPSLISTVDLEQELTIQTPYDSIYEHYLTAMLALVDGEYARYNAELGMYAALWSGYAREQRRRVKPEKKGKVKRDV